MDSPELDWTDEAQAVISDVHQHVKEISIASELKSSKNHIYVNLTTLEDSSFTVELSALGFRRVATRYNFIDSNETGEYFDTPYALLTSLSPAYSINFAESLISKLNALNDKE